jgi:coenzyme PQQ precursor peptide PqqA
MLGVRAPTRARHATVSQNHKETTMVWTRPILREICIGMEINGYLAARM